MGESGQDETKGAVPWGGALNLSSEREEGRFFFFFVGGSAVGKCSRVLSFVR